MREAGSLPHDPPYGLGLGAYQQPAPRWIESVWQAGVEDHQVGVQVPGSHLVHVQLDAWVVHGNKVVGGGDLVTLDIGDIV